MANPDFVDESVADQTGAGPTTVLMPAAWAANQIALLFIATDGYVPTLSTANGFVLAQDPVGNTASVTTSGSVAGANECGMFVFWKRLVGSTSATDPAPVVAAAPGGAGGTIQTLHINTYSNCRTSGTPFHIIATAVVTSSTTTIAPPAVTPTLNGCTLVTSVASANDDAAFNAWTFTGAASPAGQLDNGWHGNTGNGASFCGGRGGYATAGGARSGTSTFGAATKQAQITLVLASLAEASMVDEDAGVVPKQQASTVPLQLNLGTVLDEVPGTSATVIDDDQVAAAVVPPLPVPTLSAWVSSDEGPQVATVDDDPAQVTEMPPQPPVAVAAVQAPDEIPASPGTTDDDVPPPPSVAPTGRPYVPFASLDEQLAQQPTAAVDDDPGVQPALPPPAVSSQAYVTPDELASGTGTAVEEDPYLRANPAWPVPPPYKAPSQELEVGSVPPASGTIGGANVIQKSNGGGTSSGTETTQAIAAWHASTAYVVDPSPGGTNRVSNSGNLYECAAGGTSAGSSGPSGTGTAIVDGGVTWYYVGPVGTTDTTAGSQVLAFIARGVQSSVTGAIDPLDNDSGAFTVISNNAYTSFVNSFAGVWRRSTASNTKSGYSVSAFWNLGESGGDEITVGYVELQGVVVGAPHTFSHVERAAPTGGTVTAAAITTTVPCIVVSFWFGNGTVQPAGSPDTAAPAGGLVLVANASSPLSLTTNGYIQQMVAARVVSTPGTFSEVWTSTTNEGAKLYTVAYALLTSSVAPLSFDSDDPQPPSPTWPVVTFSPVFDGGLAISDDFALQHVDDDFRPASPVQQALLQTNPGPAPSEEVGQPSGTGFEEDSFAAMPTPPVPPNLVPSVPLMDDSEPSPTVIQAADDDAGVPGFAWIGQVAQPAFIADEQSATQLAADDEQPAPNFLAWIVQSVVQPFTQDDVYLNEGLLTDDDANPPVLLPWPAGSTVVWVPSEDGTGVVLDDDSPTVLLAPWVPIVPMNPVRSLEDWIVVLLGGSSPTLADDSLLGSGSFGSAPSLSGSGGIVLASDLLGGAATGPDVVLPTRVVGQGLGPGTSRRLPAPHLLVRIEDVDRGVRNWFERVADCHVTTPQGDRRKVTVKFASGERWVAAADRQGIRDRDGRLILPVIQVTRTAIDATTGMSALGSNVPRLQLARLVDDKTTNLANLDASRPLSQRRLRDGAVYDVYTIPFPTTNLLHYRVQVQCQYQSHANEVIEKIYSRLEFFDVPSFVISLTGDDRPSGIATGRGSTEVQGEFHSPYESRRPLSKFYVVGYIAGSISDGGNVAEFTDQERIIQVSFDFTVPAALILDPEGEQPSVQVDRTAFTVNLGDEEVHFVDDLTDLDRIFGPRK